MPTIELYYQMLTCRARTVTVDLDEQVAVLAERICEKEGLHASEVRFSVGAKPLLPNDKATVRELGIQARQTVMVLFRLRGGGGSQLSVGTWEQVLKMDFSSGLRGEKGRTCNFCLENDMTCVKVCCVFLCLECCTTAFYLDKFVYRCTVCKKMVSVESVSRSPAIVDSVRGFRDLLQLVVNINVTTCNSCERLLTLDGSGCETVCPCGRKFCFFCGNDWDPDVMKAGTYKCSEGCFYNQCLKMDLVKFEYSGDIEKIPSQRPCPGCLYVGAYDGKCKVHECLRCPMVFCFLCWMPITQCPNPKLNKMCCPSPRVLTFADLPRL